MGTYLDERKDMARGEALLPNTYPHTTEFSLSHFILYHVTSIEQNRLELSKGDKIQKKEYQRATNHFAFKKSARQILA